MPLNRICIREKDFFSCNIKGVDYHALIAFICYICHLASFSVVEVDMCSSIDRDRRVVGLDFMVSITISMLIIRFWDTKHPIETSILISAYILRYNNLTNRRPLDQIEGL